MSVGVSAARVVLAWVNLYSRGLPAEVADTRREEIAADLHDQASWAEKTGAARGAGIAVLVRAIKGAPADLSWRSQQLHDGPAPERVLGGSLLGLVTTGSLLMFAFATIAFVRSLRGLPSEWVDTPGVLPVGVAGLATICGLVLLSRPITRSVAAMWLLGASQIIILQGIDLFAESTTMLAWAEQRISVWPACIVALAAGSALLYLSAALWWNTFKIRARP